MIVSSFFLQFFMALMISNCACLHSPLLLVPSSMPIDIFFIPFSGSLVKILSSCRHEVDLVCFDSDISCKKSLSILFQTISKLQFVQNVLPYLSCQCMT